MKEITYLVGDATEPQGKHHIIIAHICNDIGAWGAGFTRALSQKYPQAALEYKVWFRTTAHAHMPFTSDMPFALGHVQFVHIHRCKVPEGIATIQIANMIAQRGVRGPENPIPIRYTALVKCLTDLQERALLYQASVHMPRIGCGLAGGEWSKVEPLIRDQLCDYDIPVFVYDLQSTE